MVESVFINVLYAVEMRIISYVHLIIFEVVQSAHLIGKIVNCQI